MAIRRTPSYDKKREDAKHTRKHCAVPQRVVRKEELEDADSHVEHAATHDTSWRGTSRVALEAALLR